MFLIEKGWESRLLCGRLWDPGSFHWCVCHGWGAVLHVLSWGSAGARMPGAPEAPEPLVQSQSDHGNLHLIASVVKIITQKSRPALKLCALDFVPECGPSFYPNAWKAINCKSNFLQEHVFSH